MGIENVLRIRTQQEKQKELNRHWRMVTLGGPGGFAVGIFWIFFALMKMFLTYQYEDHNFNSSFYDALVMEGFLLLPGTIFVFCSVRGFVKSWFVLSHFSDEWELHEDGPRLKALSG